MNIRFAEIGFTLLSIPAFAKPGPSLAPTSQKAQFVYLEFLPNTKKFLTVQSIKCDPTTNDLHVEKFQSISKVKDGEVNLINLYARSGDCKESPISSVWQETISMPQNGKSTHVYITVLSDSIMVL